MSDKRIVSFNETKKSALTRLSKWACNSHKKILVETLLGLVEIDLSTAKRLIKNSVNDVVVFTYLEGNVLCLSRSGLETETISLSRDEVMAKITTKISDMNPDELMAFCQINFGGFNYRYCNTSGTISYEMTLTD